MKISPVKVIALYKSRVPTAPFNLFTSNKTANVTTYILLMFLCLCIITSHNI